MKEDKLPFNSWSVRRINEGKKICTSRSRKYNDSRVYLILHLPLAVVREHLWAEEGADSPSEFEKVWRSIYRGKFDENKMVYVHFFFAGGEGMTSGRQKMCGAT
jgi:hypothetical protein